MKTMQLGLEEVLGDRPFTVTHQLTKANFTCSCASVRWSTPNCSKNPNLYAPESHELIETDGRHHRIIPIRPKLLVETESLTLVGFFGQRNLCSDAGAAASRDKMLFSEMKKHEGLLSYSSLELTNGDYGNCVVFANEHAKDNWGYSQVHEEAVNDLSPLYYKSIRLYNGSISGNVVDFYRMQLNIVKYLDYSESPRWFGSRQLA